MPTSTEYDFFSFLVHGLAKESEFNGKWCVKFSTGNSVNRFVIRAKHLICFDTSCDIRCDAWKIADKLLIGVPFSIWVFLTCGGIIIFLAPSKQKERELIFSKTTKDMKKYFLKIIAISRSEDYSPNIKIGFIFNLLLIKMLETFVHQISKVLSCLFDITKPETNLTVFYDLDSQQNGNGSSHIHSKCTNSIQPTRCLVSDANIFFPCMTVFNNSLFRCLRIVNIKKKKAVKRWFGAGQI